MKAAAESHELSQLATAPGSMHNIPGLDHCPVAQAFYSLVKVLSVFFSALLMYQLDMAKFQADVVKACISYHKREN